MVKWVGGINNKRSEVLEMPWEKETVVQKNSALSLLAGFWRGLGRPRGRVRGGRPASLRVGLSGSPLLRSGSRRPGDIGFISAFSVQKPNLIIPIV